MMRSLLLMVLLLAGYFSFGQVREQAQAFRLVDSIFHDSVCHFEITEFDFPADVRDILLRFNNTVAANKEWFEQYASHAPAGQPLPYNEKFGITPEEYGKIRNMDKVHPALKVMDTQRVVILRREGKISFKGEGDGRVLDYLEFYPDKKEVVFAGDTIPFARMASMTAVSAYGLTDGYTWRLERTDVGKTLQARLLTAHVVEIDLGIKSPENKPLLRIQYQDMENGVSRANLDLSGYIRK